MKYEWCAEQISYSIEIIPEQWQLISYHDSQQEKYEDQLAERINTLAGLKDTYYYGGQFNAYIHVNIDHPDDTSQTRAKIIQLINDFTVWALLVAIFAREEDE